MRGRNLLLATASLFLAALTAPVGALAEDPPGYTMARTGGVHDFDPMVGGWSVAQKRLKARGVGSNDWAEFTSTICVGQFIDGVVEVSEMYVPSTGHSGFTVRAFDLGKHQWVISYIPNTTGVMQPAVYGGFDGAKGEFYGEDVDGGRPIKAVNTWTIIDHDHARWEQAFSYDNKTWEKNWVADFTRIDATKACDGARPRR